MKVIEQIDNFTFSGSILKTIEHFFVFLDGKSSKHDETNEVPDRVAGEWTRFEFERAGEGREKSTGTNQLEQKK